MVRVALASLAATCLMGCASTQPAAHRTATEPPMPPTATSAADLEAAIDQRCRVVGRYELRDFHTKKGGVFATWPAVVLDDGTAVLIESLWDASKRHDDATAAAHQGKRVAVTGTLHGEPPGSMQNIAMPCLSPVDDFGLAPD